MICGYKQHHPQIDPSVFIAPIASVIGNFVTIGHGCAAVHSFCRQSGSLEKEPQL